MKRPPFDPSLAQGGLFESPTDKEEDSTDKSASGSAPLKVSQAARLVESQMTALGKLSIEGEVSSYRGANNSGHLYFSIKDSQSVLSCVVWRSKASSIPFPLKDGLLVVVSGRFNYYAEGGKLSFIVESIRATGQGDADARFRQMCAQLKEIGYFEEARKRALPLIPRGVAIITSAAGAALQDCLAVAARKFPSIPITVVDVVVQGSGAPAAIANAIQVVDRAARRLGIDVILVTRGGGSREDLEAFDQRPVADAAFHSATPIVAAIGHESDTSVIELVADARASTPTAAMNRILPDRKDLLQQLAFIDGSLGQSMERLAQVKALALSRLASRPCLRDPANLFQLTSATLDHLVKSLPASMMARFARARRLTLELSTRMESASPLARLARAQAKDHAMGQRLHAAIHQRLAFANRDSKSLQDQLQAVGPPGTLARGYSITRTSDGTLVRSVTGARTGEVIRTILVDGEIQSRIEKGG